MTSASRLAPCRGARAIAPTVVATSLGPASLYAAADALQRQVRAAAPLQINSRRPCAVDAGQRQPRHRPARELRRLRACFGARHMLRARVTDTQLETQARPRQRHVARRGCSSPVARGTDESARAGARERLRRWGDARAPPCVARRPSFSTRRRRRRARGGRATTGCAAATPPAPRLEQQRVHAAEAPASGPRSTVECSPSTRRT